MSALDLRYRFGCTPHWWQILSALADEGTDVLAVPYLGEAVESLRWRVHQNPLLWEGAAILRARRVVDRLGRACSSRWRSTAGPLGAVVSRVMGALARSYVVDRWTRLVDKLVREEGGFDAVVFFNVPLGHITGLASHIRGRYSIPVWYYDGDLPSSLPEYGGYATGFRAYDRADLQEFDGVFINSEGCQPRLRLLGARRTAVVHWAADPSIYRPLDRPKEMDAFFYGYGEEYREDWLDAMIYAPARSMPGVSFALGGLGFGGAPPQVHRLGDIPFSRFNETCARAKVNLIVTRRPHATVHASSSARPFELGAMGVATVSNPWNGLERWFEPGKEVLVATSARHARDLYAELLSHPSLGRALGKAMRARVEAEHTYAHRARQVLACLNDVTHLKAVGEA